MVRTVCLFEGDFDGHFARGSTEQSEVGVVVGHASHSREYILHLVPTPRQARADGNKKTSVNLLRRIVNVGYAVNGRAAWTC